MDSSAIKKASVSHSIPARLGDHCEKGMETPRSAGEDQGKQGPGLTGHCTHELSAAAVAAHGLYNQASGHSGMKQGKHVLLTVAPG